MRLIHAKERARTDFAQVAGVARPELRASRQSAAHPHVVRKRIQIAQHCSPDTFLLNLRRGRWTPTLSAAPPRDVRPTLERRRVVLSRCDLAQCHRNCRFYPCISFLSGAYMRIYISYAPSTRAASSMFRAAQRVRIAPAALLKQSGRRS